jgi:cation diffusion facilitator family transporter
MSDANRKVKVAALSIISNSVLIILKVIAGILSGSISVISEVIHSSMDLVASIIAFFSVKVSSKPPDKDHPYGHGKIENVSGVTEGILIFIAAFLIIKEAIAKIASPVEIEGTTISIMVMVISALINIAVSRKLYKVAKEEDSVALEADALHLKTDVYTSLGVGLGLLLIKLTGIYILDPIVGIMVALLIVKEAMSLCKGAFYPLLDTKLSDEEEEKIKDIINQHRDQIISYHKLKTRKSGKMKYIEFHMLVDKNQSVEEAHDLTEDLEKHIEQSISNTITNIHVEPDTKLIR